MLHSILTGAAADRRRACAPWPGVLLPVALLLLGCALPARAATRPHLRDGWILGLGFGGGSAGFHVAGESTDRRFGSAGNLRAGFMVRPNLSIGLETNVWFKTIEGVDWTLDMIGGGVTWYPGDRFFLRGAAGGGSATAEIPSGSRTESVSQDGFGATAGAGYEVRFWRSWALAPQVDFTYLRLDNDNANWVSFGCAAHWYILPHGD